MRQKMVWRYYCDFCKKAGCGKGAMAKHERHCCRNPSRVCRMCEAGGIGPEQQPMSVLLAALTEGGLERLKEVAQNCPACILAALIQDRVANPIVDVGTQYEYKPSREYIQFDYKAACEAFWVEVNVGRREWEGVY